MSDKIAFIVRLVLYFITFISSLVAAAALGIAGMLYADLIRCFPPRSNE
jgi:hypothetical protein